MRLTNDIRSTMIASIMADIPLVDHEGAMQKRATAIAVERMPPPIRTLYSGANKHWVAVNRAYICCVSYYLPGLADADSREALEKAIEEDEAWKAAHEARDAQRDNLAALRISLRANLESCSTRKQFIERFPDLAKYAPQVGETVANLPATNELVGRLQSAGLLLEAA